MTTATNEFLTASNFSIDIAGLDGLSVAVQSVTHPSVTVRPARQSTRRVDIPLNGTKAEYADLSVVMNLDDGMKSYDMIYQWLLNCQKGPVSRDITVGIYTIAGRPARRIVYKDAFPTVMSSLEFSSTQSEDPILSLTVDFTYSSFEILAV